MKYKINQLAKIAGVSIRTLHYYDQIDLLKPEVDESNGYRYYQSSEFIKLQQILYLKELDFPLSDISKILSLPESQKAILLEDQKKLLQLKKDRLELLITAIDQNINQLKKGQTMKTNNLFSPFNEDKIVEYKAEAKKRWGNTKAYQQSMERTKHWTKADYAQKIKDWKQFTQKLADAMDQDIQSQEVQALIEQQYQSINSFYDCSTEMFRGLAQMYVDDPRFKSNYDSFRPGLAEWLREAINYYCDKKDQKYTHAY